MGLLVLSESDREKFGVNGPISFEHGQYGLRSVKAMEKATGYTLRWVEHQLAGVPVMDADGNVETVTVTKDDGTEEVRPRLRTDSDAIAAWVWLVLWNNQIKLDWETFDVNPVGLRIDFSDGDSDEGKAQEPSPTTDSANTPST